MHCSGCHVDIAPDSRFCHACGAPVAALTWDDKGNPTSTPRYGEEPGATPHYGSAAGPPRQVWMPWVDPTEGAFGALVPRGWQVQGGIVRGGPTPTVQFSATADGCGFVLAPESYQFVDGRPMGGLLGMLGGGWMTGGAYGESRPYEPAAQLVQSLLLPGWRKRWPDVFVMRLAENPAECRKHLEKMQRECLNRGMMMQVDGSVADVVIGYTERGVQIMHGGRVTTSRTSGMGAVPLWFAEVSAAWYAPRERFAAMEPTFLRMLESVRFDPHWEAMQLAGDNARAMMAQSDIHRRQLQISQTLSETSDIVASGYWSQQHIHQEHQDARQAAQPQDDWQHRYSNATLGWEDRVDDTGQRYTIEAGHERVWRDDAGKLYYGNQLTNPDPRWHELKPGS